MATSLGRTYFDTNANYELAYDLLSQNTANNTSTVRLYGILHVTGYSIYWSWGNATVHTETARIGTSYSRGDYTVIQRDFTFTHNSDGTFSSWIGGGINTSYKSGSTGGTMTLPTIPRASQPSINTYPNNSPNFNIGDTIVIHMNRKSNSFTHKVYFKYGSTNYLVADNVVNNCTFDTSIVANDLYALIPNTNVYSNVISVDTYNGSTKIGTKTCPYNASVINANPIFNNFEFEDVNATTLALTGNSQKCINGYSNIKATISTINKAEAQKGASMSKYRFIIGNTSSEIAYKSDASASSIINNAENGTFNVYAIDSRNNSTLVTKLAETEIIYGPIYLDKQNSKIERDDNRVGDGAILTLNGTLWNDSFGDVVNSITSVTYRLKKTDSSTWINGTTTITPIVTDNTFMFSGMIASDNLDTTWDLDASYNIEVTIADELSTTTAEFILNSAVPTMSLDKNGVGIMGAYDNSEGGALQLEGQDIIKIITNKIKGVELYSTTSTSATSSAITLSDDASNYHCIEVFYGYGIGADYESITSSRLYNPDGKTINLSLLLEGSGGTNIQIYLGIFSVSGNKITPLNWYGGGQVNNNSATTVGKRYNITITKVIGYK